MFITFKINIDYLVSDWENNILYMKKKCLMFTVTEYDVNVWLYLILKL